jgi:hypothetical protein
MEGVKKREKKKKKIDVSVSVFYIKGREKNKSVEIQF